MPDTARLTLTTATVLLTAAVCTPAYASALREDSQSRVTTGPTISHGADGTEQTLMCPPEENVLSGGFTVSAPSSRTLDAEPGDVLTSRPTADATGWIVAVNKSLRPASDAAAPADITLYVVCTEGETSPGD
jgi:hypothetical protein